jgi:polysaccharide export outer membrane protein
VSLRNLEARGPLIRVLSSWSSGCFRKVHALALVTGLACFACASTGPFVWYSQLPRGEWAAASGEYVIGVGDSVNIRVYEQAELSATLKIRSDGRVALPLVGDVLMAGKHPSELSRELETKLKQYVVAPRVTVNVDVSQPITITTLGEIKSVGNLTVERPARLLQVLAQAGGLTEFADESRIFVLRNYPRFQRIRFTYEAIVNNTDNAATFPLRGGDVVVVE